MPSLRQGHQELKDKCTVGMSVTLVELLCGVTGRGVREVWKEKGMYSM